MEIRNFESLKAEGKAALVRHDADTFEVHLAQFKTEDGAPDAPAIVGLTLSGLEHALGVHTQAIADHTAEIEGIRKLLAEMEALNATAPAEAANEAGG